MYFDSCKQWWWNKRRQSRPLKPRWVNCCHGNNLHEQCMPMVTKTAWSSLATLCCCNCCYGDRVLSSLLERRYGNTCTLSPMWWWWGIWDNQSFLLSVFALKMHNNNSFVCLCYGFCYIRFRCWMQCSIYFMFNENLSLSLFMNLL